MRGNSGASGTRLVAGEVGIIVAGDMPARWLGELEARSVDPVEIVFRFRDGHQPPFAIPCRPPNGLEVIMLVNRALAEGQVEFGFRPKQAPPLVLPGEH